MKRDYKCTKKCFVQLKMKGGRGWSKVYRVGEIIQGVDAPPKHHEHHFQAIVGSELKYKNPEPPKFTRRGRKSKNEAVKPEETEHVSDI